MGFFSAPQDPLTVPGTSRRLIRLPEVQSLFTSRLSGAPLSSSEIDYDELVVLSSYRSYEADRPGEVRYFMYKLCQKNPGESGWSEFWKAVRMVRLTRVPRYLRQGPGAGPAFMFEQHRDLLAALREQQVLFLNMIAKSPQLPLIFAYGVQGVGDTPEQAQQLADEAYAVLTYQLDGTYQQLEYTPITFHEAELVARYQSEWRHLAMGRGRPLPANASTGTNSILDGNRTDLESVNNQLESFIRGMGDRSFLLSLITVPLAPAAITMAWRNITEKLSNVRSDQEGARSVTAGVALPLTMANSLGDGHGNTHSAGTSAGVSATDGTSHSIAGGVTESTSHGTSTSTSQSQSDGVNQSVTDSVNQSVSHGQSVNHSDSIGRSDSTSTGQSVSQGVGTTHTDGTSLSAGVSRNDGVAVTQTDGTSQGAAVNQTAGTSSSHSLGQTASVGQNWNNSIGQSVSGSTTQTAGTNNSQTNGMSQSVNLGNTHGDSMADAWNQAWGNSFNGGLLGLGGGANSQQGQSGTANNNDANSLGLGLTGSGSHTTGVNQSLAQALSRSVNLGESFGGNTGLSASATNTVGDSHSVGVTQSVGTSHSTGSTHSAGVGQNLTQGASASDALSRNVTQGASVSQGSSLNQGTSLSQGQSLTQTAGVGHAESAGQSRTVTQGQTQGVNDSTGRSTSLTSTDGTNSAVGQNQGLSDAYMVAMSRQASASSSLAIAPSFGVTLSKATKDEAKRFVGDILEAQMRRYADGIKSGGFLYQMFMVAPDRETLAGGAGLLKSAFWGAGGADTQLPQPFSTITDFPIEGELDRLLTHAQAFTSYRRREPDAELIEPFKYSTYATPQEIAAFCHPPTAEGVGLLTVHDSMPVLRMPYDRQDRDIRLGHIVNGERAKISDVYFGIDVDEITHLLIAGHTGSGKTTTLMRFLTDALAIEREVIIGPTIEDPTLEKKVLRPSVLFFDWMRNGRDLASVVDADRFQFFSMMKPELGEFRWNLLAIPSENVVPTDWLNAQCDNFTAAFNLGEFGRSLMAQFLGDLYSANRLQPFVLRPAVTDDHGVVLREAIELPALDRAGLPADAVMIAPNGEEIANVYTCPDLSRCVSMADLAVMVSTYIEELAKPESARMTGTAMRDRLQSLWRRMMYFAPGGQFDVMLGADPDLQTRECLTVWDLVDPDTGMVTVIETDGLDIPNRRVILGSILLALYKTGLSQGEGTFDHNGKGPGTFVVLEEAHELFGEQNADEDVFSASARTALYESMFRRARALGMRLVVLVQNPAAIPAAITSNTSTVIVHTTYDDADRKRIFSLLNWQNQIGRHVREFAWLGEMPIGWALVRLPAKKHYLEAAPVQIVVDPPPLRSVDDTELARLAQLRAGDPAYSPDFEPAA